MTFTDEVMIKARDLLAMTKWGNKSSIEVGAGKCASRGMGHGKSLLDQADCTAATSVHFTNELFAR